MAAECSNIIFLGHQSGDRLRMLFEGAIATIVPSLWYEVFGIVILESLARATPVIVRNIGGMPKIIAESGGGVTFDNDEQLLEAVDSLMADPHLRRRLGQQGHAEFQQRWTADVHVPIYLSLIMRLLESGTRKAGNATRQQVQVDQDARVTAGTVS